MLLAGPCCAQRGAPLDDGGGKASTGQQPDRADIPYVDARVAQPILSTHAYSTSSHGGQLEACHVHALSHVNCYPTFPSTQWVLETVFAPATVCNRLPSEKHGLLPDQLQISNVSEPAAA